MDFTIFATSGAGGGGSLHELSIREKNRQSVPTPTNRGIDIVGIDIVVESH
jgi:hypothetical protein